MALSILVAGPDIQSLPDFVSARNVDGQVVAHVEPSEFRDLTVVELLVSSVIAGSIKLVFDLLKDFIKEKWLSQKSGASPSDQFSLRVGAREIAIRRDMTKDEIDHLLLELRTVISEQTTN